MTPTIWPFRLASPRNPLRPAAAVCLAAGAWLANAPAESNGLCLLMLAAALLLLLGGLGAGAWRHYQAQLRVAATAEQNRDFVPSVRVATVRASGGFTTVSLPATTTAPSRHELE